jgi:DNA replication and checkpoint protein
MSSRTRLASECHEIRAQLKEWEKDFAEANSGRKPGKEDIKKNPGIAAQYKTYNRTRDVLDGKKELDSLQARSSSVRRHKSTSSLKAAQRDQIATPKKAHPFATPRKIRPSHTDSHPSVLDPYDAPPASVSPHPYVFKNAIGPTPQRDGKILGLFDLLSKSGSTPSSKKRKVDSMEGESIGMNVAQTPSKRPVRAGDLLAHLADDSGGRHHSRTPASDGKKFLLSQFFATPSTMRFATIAEEDGDDTIEKGGVDRTPLRTKVLGGRADNRGESDNASETTPAFLRRTTSFNQRLLTASGSVSQKRSSSTNLAFGSPSAIRRGPAKRPFKGRGLSEILRGLRQMEDDDDEDEIDALREMEGNDVNLLVADSQSMVKPPTVEEGPGRIWKKKGQKRTMRRVIMRPTTMQRQPREAEFDDEDQLVVEGGIVKVEETQGEAFSSHTQAREYDEDEDSLRPIHDDLEDRENSDNKSNYDDDPGAIEEAEEVDDEDAFADSDYDELASTPRIKHLPKKPNGLPEEPASTIKLREAPPPQKEDQHTTKKKKKKKNAQKEKNKASGKAEGKEKGTSNPNAVSHMNFRSLKIRNKNSKAGGKGRFGRGRR